VGAVRASLVHYNTVDEVERMGDALVELARAVA
jgi:selenocysteine lyase/cysteine desulfurase